MLELERACSKLNALLIAGAMVAATLFAANVSAQAPKEHRASAPSEIRSDKRVAPQVVSYENLSTGKFRDQLISVSGLLVSQLRDADSAFFSIESNGHLIHAILRQNAVLDSYAAGSTVQITGFWRMSGEDSQAHALAYIEVRNANDVALLSAPSWFTLSHLLTIFGLVALIIAGFSIRAAFLKWRKVNETAWIDRATVVAHERSRILEMISSNQTLDVSLGEICKSSMELLPGTTCAYSLKRDTEMPSEQEQPADPQQKTIYEVTLKDDRGETNGSILVTADKDWEPHADREEVFSLISELSLLAMRQFLLYRGLVYHSTHDPLTELPNRRLCESHLDAVLKEAEETGGRLAVIYIDINRFKYVNDKYGHKTGDLYLQQISSRLRAQLRSIDMLARVGGDEFVVIAPFPEYYDRAYAISARLRACFQDPFSLDGEMIDGSASFGIARYPEHGMTAEELTRHADHEMYIAKHEAHISEEAHGLAIITVSELELALLNGSFRLAYQPQFSAAGRLTGLEALLRLDDPVLGLLTPDAFISIAEQNRVIVDIGTWALRTALRDAVRWGLNRGEFISVAVNVSVRQLEEPGYANSVLAFLREYSFPPNRLEIELIERSLMFSGDQVLQQLEQLRLAGVRITLDDFGTEQSCLSLLHKLPIDTIKLDRSFIRVMDSEPAVVPIIQAIVSMAQSLGKRIVAEAIEHVGPVPALMKMGSMDFQGYLLSRPVAAEEMQLIVGDWRAGIVMPEAFREPKLGQRDSKGSIPTTIDTMPR